MPNYKGHRVEVLTPVKKEIIDRVTKPYDVMNDGPFKKSLDKMEGVFRKEVVTYKVENGYLFKETAIRDFSDGDYHDTVKIETLHSVEK
tara:strand:- start:456 stop:722 length:267 start_codon:yes stop_codon:yes gene_type:complete